VREGIEAVAAAIDGGRAAATLERLVEASQQSMEAPA
jgi:anthranilate phosphoribosyltransferase